ncbi:MAG: acetate--CoA ligase family protein [Anaerolineales bacterium]
MEKIFYPKSLVVVGVSDKADNLARNIANNLLLFGYQGEMYLLGRQAGRTLDHPIYTSVDELPPNLDLAVILTPAATVPGLLDDLGKRGVRYAVIETAGFSEFSEEGAKLEREIGQIAKKWDMRIVGPNCVGIINTESGICTIFVHTEPSEMMPGRTSLISQSGGVVLTCTDMMTACGLGVAKTVSVGNKLDLKESDYLKYFLQDNATDIIMLYLESINAGRELVELAGKSLKPVIVYKSNTGQASAQIAQSHTAALANDERVVNAAFAQFGITRAYTFRQMMTFGKGFSLPPVRGNRLAVFSRSGGHAIISVDCASEFGFILPPYPDELIEIAKPFFRVNVIERINPLDLGTVFNFDSYPLLIEEAMKIMQPDAVLLIFNYRRETIPKAREVAERLKALSLHYQIPVALVYFTEMDEIAYLEKNLGFPVFPEVYEAVQALAASRDHYFRLKRREAFISEATDLTIPANAATKARNVLKNARNREVSIDQAMQICEDYGLSVARWAKVSNADQGAQEAGQIGYPVVVKVAASGATHKTDVGGVALDIKNEGELRKAIEQMQQRLGPSSGFLIQKMVYGGREVILGGKRDPSFGPLILFGLGGIYAEVFSDVTIRLVPVAKGEVEEMLDELRGAKLLKGVRGQPSADHQALVEMLLKLSRLMEELDEIAEIDLNPVLVFEHGAQIVDARIILRD